MLREQGCPAGSWSWEEALWGQTTALACGDQPFLERFHQNTLPPSAASRASLVSKFQALLFLIPFPPRSSQGQKGRSVHEGLMLSPLPWPEADFCLQSHCGPQGIA